MLLEHRRELLHHHGGGSGVLTETSLTVQAYDTVLLGSLLGLPAFQKRFGVYSAKTKGYQLQASW